MPVFLLQLFELCHEVVSYFFSIFVQFLFPDDVQHFNANSALEHSTSESIEVDLLNGVKNLPSGDDCTHGHSISDSLCHGDDIRLDSLPSMTPIFGSNSSEAGLNLISYNQSSLFPDKFSHSGCIISRKGAQSSNTLDRLKDESCNFVLSCLRIKCFLGIFDH